MYNSNHSILIPKGKSFVLKANAMKKNIEWKKTRLPLSALFAHALNL